MREKPISYEEGPWMLTLFAGAEIFSLSICKLAAVKMLISHIATCFNFKSKSKKQGLRLRVRGILKLKLKLKEKEKE